MITQLKCPNCNRSIASEDINIHKLIAKCGACYAIFDFDDHQQAPVKKERPNISLPVGFEEQQMVSEMQIAIRWRKTKGMVGFFTFFTVFWNVLLLPFILIAVAENNWQMMLMISLHIAVGVGMLLYTLALHFNRTYVDVNTHGITVVSKPINLPFYKNHHVQSADLEQLYVEQYVSSTTNNKPNYAFAVRARIQGQTKDVRLIKGLKDEDQALYLEHKIEKFLNIEDKWMATPK
jgi:hypothetical protein